MNKKQGGFTLIELMISMALGIVVIGAILVMYTNGSSAMRYALAQGQMNEDAQMALSVITQELRKAGNNPARPTGATTTARNDLGQSGWGIFACDTGFSDNTVALVSGLTCAAAGANAALAVVSEGDLVSGKNTGANLPMDCIGNGVAVQGASVTGGNFFTMQSRFFIANNALNCIGSGGVVAGSALTIPAQVLAENIESMSFLFGIGSVANKRIVQGYLSPSAIALATGDAGFDALTLVQRWDQVVSARVCVVIRSENPVLRDVEANPTYRDCNEAEVAIADGRLRRAYRTTVLLRNHGVGYAE
jgi:type IV pilus assembly protein PilW